MIHLGWMIFLQDTEDMTTCKYSSHFARTEPAVVKHPRLLLCEAKSLQSLFQAQWEAAA